MKLGMMKAQLPWALEEADLSFCLQGNYGWDAHVTRWHRWARKRSWPIKVDALADAVAAAARPGDHVLVHEQRQLWRYPRQDRSAGLHNRVQMTARPQPISHVLYLHGFRSSPHSFKARRMAEWLAASAAGCALVVPATSALATRRRWTWCATELARWPVERMAVHGLARSVASTPPWWPRSTGCRAVLLNPAINPARDLAGYIGDLTSFHNPDDALLFQAPST